MKRDYALLVNPASDSGRSLKYFKSHEQTILDTLEDSEVFILEDHQSLIELSSSLCDSFKVIIACGGDGTARNVGTGLINKEALMGVLPMGSGNDFAKMIGVSKLSLQQQLNVILQAQIRKVDILKINNEYALNTYGIGFNGYTNLLASQSWIKGSLKYVTAGLKALMSSKRVKVDIKGDTYSLSTQTELIALANGKWEGGKYLISSESDHSDGKFELLVLKKISKLRLAYEFVKLSLGGKLSDEIVHKSAHSRLTVKLEKPLQIHADGEVIPVESRFDISLISGAVQVIEARV